MVDVERGGKLSFSVGALKEIETVAIPDRPPGAVHEESDICQVLGQIIGQW
jgi:hypothetical protein